MTATFHPSPTQRRIVEAPAEARLIVDAGPGTGKTATAAARVLALLEGGMPPQSLWMVSFARAAVLEMRQRLIAFGADAPMLPRVTTLDSLAWRLRGAEFDGADPVLEGHDAAIAETLDLMRLANSQVAGQLGAIGHVLLDETQDFVGVRALLIVELVARLPPACGVTILTDEAQAIYGFSGAAATASLEGDTVAQHLLAAGGYQRHVLTEVHRTDRLPLLRLFAAARREVMREAANPAHKLARVRRTVIRRAAKPWWHKRPPPPDDADTLILYRSRAEVLAEATARGATGRPFRLRLSGLPAMLHPWIALTLADFEGQFLSRARFLDLWRGADDEAEAAWAALGEATGTPQRIEMKRLLTLLRASNPPLPLCRFDPGAAAGPIVGTIHASKGREMPHVRLMLPVGGKGRDDPEAEARVLFVGATRARLSLHLGAGMRLESRRLPSGRVYLAGRAGQCRCEMGRPHDFDWLAGYRAMPALADVLLGLTQGQALKVAYDRESLSLHHEGVLLGIATPALLADLRDLRARLDRQVDYRPFAARCGPIHFLGVRSLAVPPEAAGPKTGLYLVPAVTGLINLEFYPL